MHLDKRAAKNIFYGRQSHGAYDSLEKLDAVPYVGADAFQKLLAYARAHNLVPRCGDGSVQPGEEQCDGGAGCSNACRFTFRVGNGVVENGEECDDGNTRDNDGCSATGAWEIAQANGLGYENARDVGTYRFVAGHFSARSGSQYWKLTVTRPSHISIDILANDINQPISHDAFEAGRVDNAPNQGDGWSFGEHGVPDAYSRTAAFWSWYWDDSCSSSGCSLPDYNSVKRYTVRRTQPGAGWDGTFDVQPGVYYLGFQTGAGNENYSPPISYIAEIDVQANGPVCGDGQVQPGETCDDGAMVDGDGCSRRCAQETLPESEPNDRRESAQPLRSFHRVHGTIGVGDEDWYALAVGAAGTLTAHFDGCPFDGVLELYDAAGARVAIDDDGAGGYCPLLRVRGLAAGGYTLRVRHANARIAGGDYTLVLE
jgi:cysteine-rich repeat protein